MKKYFKIIIISLLVIGVIIFKAFRKEEIVQEISDFEKNQFFLEENYVVEVKGEVNRPGVYIVGKEARVNDVIELALGFTEKADTEKINLASKVTDGMLIYVSTIIENIEENLQKVSINKATLKELDDIPNVGESTANKIVSFREKNGPYKKIEDIKKAGITDALFEKIKDYICL